jgi:hypothetical protein
MKRNLLIIALFIFNISNGQTNKRTTDEEKLTKCILENTNNFTFDGQKAYGKGWNILDSLFFYNQFVAWGEYHNSPLLSQLTAYSLESASKYGFKNWCIETSPFLASELFKFSRSKNTTDTILRIAEKVGLPFFRTKEDASMLIAANKFKYNIWGLDQECQATFPYCITAIYNSQPKNFRKDYKPVYDSLIAKWWYPSNELLDSLKNGLTNAKYAYLINDIKIGKNQLEDNDNVQRAEVMKSNFFSYYDKARTKDEKVFFKMGANHLAKGMNLMTKLFDIGNAVFELSQRNKTKFANVCIMVRYTENKGVITDDFLEKENEYPKVFTKLYEKEKWVLVDLKNLRLRMRYDNSLTADTYKVIEKYDYVLVSPETLLQ